MDEELGRVGAAFIEATNVFYFASRRLEILRIIGTKAEFEEALVLASDASELMEATGMAVQNYRSGTVSKPTLQTDRDAVAR